MASQRTGCSLHAAGRTDQQRLHQGGLKLGAEILPSPEALKNWVFAFCGDEERCVALIDPSRYRDVDACRLALDFDQCAFDALPNLYAKYAASVRENGPRLFTAPRDAPSWESVFTAAFHHQAASFIVLAGSEKRLEEHLLQRIRMPQPGGGNALFRFQDVVVLSTLAPLLRPDQKRALLGPASHWLMADLCSKPVLIATSKTARSYWPLLKLDQGQLGALDAALAALTIIFQANETDSTLLGDLDKCAQVKLIRRRIQEAHGHGLSREEDIALYCVLSLQLPEGFDVAGPIADALKRSRTLGSGFGEEIDQVPVERWREFDEVLDARRGE